MMGSKEEDIPTKPTESIKFMEDMDESELQSALEMPAGLQNLGNTCYMNATVQCLKTVPEFKDALLKFDQSKTLLLILERVMKLKYAIYGSSWSLISYCIFI